MDSKTHQDVRDMVFFRWKPAAVLRVTGEDSFTFLQGQFSNDLRSLDRAEDAVYGLWLNHKGRVIADSFIRRSGEEDFLVLSYFCTGQVIRERLEAFVIADDVLIEDVADKWRGLTVFGDSEGDSFLEMGGGSFAFRGRRSASDHREYIFPIEFEAAVESRLAGGREVGTEEVERRRIADGIASVPFDIGPGELPNEGALEAAAISYTKGCYLGQEVMARLKSMGQVRRRLLRVQGSTPIPQTPASLFQGDRRIGEMRTQVPTAEGFIGLALLSLLNLQRETALSFTPGSDGVVSVMDIL